MKYVTLKKYGYMNHKDLDDAGLLITDKTERSYKYVINIDKIDQMLGQ